MATTTAERTGDQWGVLDPSVGARVDELAGLPLERIEHEMLSLEGHLAAAKCSFLLMVGEFDADGAGSHWTGDPLDWDCCYAALANGTLATDPALGETTHPGQPHDVPLPHGSCGSGTLTPAAGTRRRGPH